jgi:hypothetical protein
MMMKGAATKIAEANYTPTISDTTNVSFRNGHYLIDSNFMMDLDITVVWSGASGGSGSVWFAQLPTGWILDTARLSNTTDNSNEGDTLLGSAEFWNQGVNILVCTPNFETTSKIVLHDNGGGTVLDNAQGAADGLKLKVRVPVKAG